jgi:hypothetical protein
MKRYKKLQSIGAEQWTDDYTPPPICFGECPNSRGKPHPHLHTVEGNVALFKGYWVAYGDFGEVWPISPNFMSTYYAED